MSFDWTLLGPPLLAGLLVVATHVTLGREVLRRGIIFIDLTIAQIAALGVIGLLAMGADDHGWALQVAAGVSALIAAGVLSWTEHKFPQIQEPLIGSLYVVAASSALLLLAHSPHGAEHMTELLAGQILWVSYAQLLPVAGLYALVLAAWALAGEHRRTLFYFLFALTVTASVQLVGVYLVFASLILPALAVLGMGRRGVALAYGIGALGYALGLSISVPLDLPSGPLVVCALAVLSLIAGVTGRLLRGSRAA
ncbi:MAG: metal transporter permease [Hydrocarboniphaga sp.]|uniref:metal ABC transporter permease n=1 Tax=Hydrocarboniphaga sp. TaxID=2033016 RepID=UPI00263340CB|nr:metal ABC transporter permease [Hydrocarboniphaga sp.]MDB5972142.1 metal transporter permease [Hydrocarboniphaga sp.]